MKEGYELRSQFNSRYSILVRRIIRMLSDNSRIKISEMAKNVGLSRRTIAIRLGAIEKEFGLSYTLDLNEEKLGLLRPHLILVKFNAKPDYNRIRELLKQSHIPQVAATIKGTYDLFIYANALSGREYAHWDKSMQTMLADYKVEWHASEVVHRQLGFFPLRNEIIGKTGLKEKYKKMLMLLNGNSRIRFQGLAKELKMNVNTVAYNFNNLMKFDYINGFTLAMDLPRELSLMSFFSKYIPAQGYENASMIARECFTSDDPDPLISRYILTAPLIGSYDFFTIGAFDNFKIAYRKDVLYHKHVFKKYSIKMLYGEIDKVILGRLPIRSVDTKKNYKTLVWST